MNLQGGLLSRKILQSAPLKRAGRLESYTSPSPALGVASLLLFALVGKPEGIEYEESTSVTPWRLGHFPQVARLHTHGRARHSSVPLQRIGAGGIYRAAAGTLMRATPYRSASGRITLKLEGSFSFADALQLGLPLTLTVTQGQLSARFDLAGNVFTSVAGGPEQPAPGPGVLGVAQREISLALPSDFTAGPASAQIVATYDGKPIASNQLGVTL